MLRRAINRLVDDIVLREAPITEVHQRLVELAGLYDVSSVYLQGYIWGRVVMLARQAVYGRASIERRKLCPQTWSTSPNQENPNAGR